MSDYRKGIEKIIAESGIEAEPIRRLVYHPESECVFEVHTDLEWEACAENCDDVTGDEYFEKLFKDQVNDEEKEEEEEESFLLN